jgi:hypothetical protein
MKAQLACVVVGKFVVAGIGCGGATSSSLAGPDGAAVSSVAAVPDGAASSVSPSGLGSTLGGNPDAGLSFGVTTQVADGCDALCAKEATANCPNQGTTAACAVGCRLLLNNPACATAANALLACAGTSTVSCDSTGKATLDNCGVQTLSSAACFLQNAMDPTLQAPCTTYCSKVTTANCPNDTPSGCQQGCQTVGGFIPACDPLWKAYVTCADGNGVAVTCGNDGKAGAPSCVVQALTYAACLLGGVSTTIDAGQD